MAFLYPYKILNRSNILVCQKLRNISKLFHHPCFSGAGFQFLNDILKLEGASKCLLNADIPYSKESLNQILESLSWLGIEYDQGPYVQSDRLEHYIGIAHALIDRGLAYKCFMTNQEVEELKIKAAKEKRVYKYPRTWRDRKDHPKNSPYVIRFKTPDNVNIEFVDTLRGKIKVESNNLDDFIIIRSDGYPTYNFSTVIDDAEMYVTNVIRGEDHLSNTSKQILIFESIEKKPPVFTHVSMILGKDKSKLSKRNGSKSINDFKKEGILPISILNYLARLGWSHGDQEIFTLNEMMELFDINNLTKSPAIFSIRVTFPRVKSTIIIFPSEFVKYKFVLPITNPTGFTSFLSFNL